MEEGDIGVGVGGVGLGGGGGGADFLHEQKGRDLGGVIYMCTLDNIHWSLFKNF